MWRKYLSMLAIVTMSATLSTAVGAVAAPFTDVPTNHGVHEAAVFLKDRGVVQGYTDGALRPETTINRAEFIKTVLAGRTDLSPSYETAHSFPDVPADAWYAPYISTAKQMGIVGGYPDGLFRPEQSITPPEAWKIILETYPLAKVDGEYATELEMYAGQWFLPYLEQALAHNIVGEVLGWEALITPITRGTAFEEVYRTIRLREGGQGVVDRALWGYGGNTGVVQVPLGESVVIPMYGGRLPQELEAVWYRGEDPMALLERQQRIPAGQQDHRMMVPMDIINDMEEVKREAVQMDSSTNTVRLASVAAGWYAVVLYGQGTPYASVFINSSDLGVVGRFRGDHGLLWAVSHDGGQPVAGVTIQYRDGQWKELRRGETNNDGIHQYTGIRPQIVLASHEGQWSVVWMYDHMTPDSTTSMVAYGYTERPLYRPGDMVHAKVIARKNIPQGYGMPGASEGWRVQIRSVSGDNIVYETTPEWNSYGSHSLQFSLPEDAATGSYSILLTGAGYRETVGYFNVEAYQKDEYSIAVTPQAAHYIQGQEIRMKVEATYYWGAPLSGQQVSYEVQRTGGWYPQPWETGEPMMDMARPSIGIMPWNSEVVASGTGTLDEQGTFMIQFDTDEGREPFAERGMNSMQQYRVVVTIQEESNRALQGEGSVTVYPAEFAVEATLGTTFPMAEEEQIMTIRLETPDGTLVQRPVVLNMELERTVYERVNEGRGSTITQYTESVDTQSLTVANGTATVEFTPELAGSYVWRFTGKDTMGNDINQQFYFQVRSDEGQFLGGYWGYGYMEMTADQERYMPGETATIAVDTGVGAGALLVVYAQERILSYDLMRITGASMQATRSMKATDAPGVLVYGHALGQEGFVEGATTLQVPYTEEVLDITVRPAQEKVGPGEEATYHVTMQDHQGRPVQGEFSLAVIDEAVLALQTPHWEQLQEIFYPQYLPYYFTTANSATQGGGYWVGSMDRAADSEEVMVGAPASSAPTAEIDGTSAITLLREEFLDTAYVVMDGETNGQGQATVRVTMPHNMTTWRAVVLGLTKDTKVGLGETTVLVTKDIMMSPQLPRILRQGDKATMRTVIHNNTGAPITARAQVSMQGGTLLSAAQQTIGVGARGRAVVSWDIMVAEQSNVEELQWDMTLFTGTTVQDRVRRTIPVLPLGQRVTLSHNGEGTGDFVVTTPGDSMERVHLVITPTLADNVVRSLEYLVGFPYGCVEQTMSRFLPTVIAYGAKDTLRFGRTDMFADMDAMITQGMDRLAVLQNNDGGWGWWENDTSAHKNTAYVMYGLTMAKEAGIAVPQDMYQKGVTYLEREGALLARSASKDRRYLPSFVYVLALNDQDRSAWISATDLQSMVAGDLAYLALAHHHLGQEEAARDMIGRLEAKIEVRGSHAYVVEEGDDYERMYGRAFATALSLEAMVTITPANGRVEPMLRWLDSIRIGYNYGETHTTAHAVMALIAYMKAHGSGEDGVGYVVEINGTVLERGTLTGMKEWQLDPALFADGATPVRITKTGSGPLFYTLTATGFEAGSDHPPVQEGFRVERRYLNEQGRTINTPVVAGTMVRVVMEVTAEEDSYYVMLQDSIPAGFEAVNPRLIRDSGFLEGVAQDGGWVDHQDYYDDHVALFRTQIPRGTHRFSYYLRAVTPGTYRVAPSHVEMMYAPDRYGTGQWHTLEVAK